MRTKPLLIPGAAALALAIPALAQQGTPPAQPVAPATAPTTSQATPVGTLSTGPAEGGVQELNLQLPPPPPPVEYPGWARRDPWSVGVLDPSKTDLGANPWGGTSGTFLSVLMRRTETPLASRWVHIALRDALLAKTRAPRTVNPVDWVAERAWLLLRMGEADGARMLVSDVDTDRFTPKMTQVGVQTALATADPPALCPLEERIRKADPAIRELVSAMCQALSGEPETASAQIDHARRFGRIGGIDLMLAQKVVGAAGSGRAATIEWDPVDTLTSWRFGLATGTGMAIPDRLINSSSSQLRAFQARAPLLSPQQRLASARIAAGLGVFSSQSLTDLYSAIYDATDPSDLPETDAWQVRMAFVGKDRDTKIAAIRKLLGNDKDSLDREASRALAARAAMMIEPDAELQADVPELISAMLAGGYDAAAMRWAPTVRRMNGDAADRSWAMLALASASPRGLDISTARINGFISRDKSPERMRSALLVAGLAGLGRINTTVASNFNRRYSLGIAHHTSWTRMIDGAADRGQAGTVLVLTGVGFQTPTWDRVPGSHLYRAVAALEETGQDFMARMIAAEALSRT